MHGQEEVEMSLTVEIPDKLAARLKQRAEESGKQPGEAVVEIVEKELAAIMQDKPMTERERIRAILKEAGMLSEVSPELLKRYVTTRTPEEREELLKRLQQISISPTFSEMIIEDRKAH
jgi:hypothetical protein